MSPPGGQGQRGGLLGRAPGRAVPRRDVRRPVPTRRGRPSVPADVVATVMVLQALEGLSDREAAAQLRTNIAWKVARGSRWPIRASTRRCSPCGATSCGPRPPQRIFDAVRAVVDGPGRSRQAPPGARLDGPRRRRGAPGHHHAARCQIRRVREPCPRPRHSSSSAHDRPRPGHAPV